MKRKKIAAICASVTVIAALAIGGTLAYLHNTTETATNKFASSKKIDLELREPGWDGYEFGDTGYQNGAGAKTNAADLGFNMAKNYAPGDSIGKNPQVKNTGTEGEAIYTALLVQYYKVEEHQGTAVKTQMSYDAFKAAYLTETGIEFNTANWSKIGTGTKGSELYMYGTAATAGTALAVDGVTTPALFSAVPLSLDLVPDENGVMPQFEIQVKAYAIQVSNIAATDAAAQLTAFVGNALQ